MPVLADLADLEVLGEAEAAQAKAVEKLLADVEERLAKIQEEVQKLADDTTKASKTFPSKPVMGMDGVTPVEGDRVRAALDMVAYGLRTVRVGRDVDSAIARARAAIGADPIKKR